MRVCICNGSPLMTQYCLFFAHQNQTFQEVTHPNTTFTKVILTAEFWLVNGHHDFETHCVNKSENIHISTFSFLGDMGRHNHPFLGPSASASDPYGFSSLLVSKQVLASDPHKLVYAPSSQTGQ